MNITTRQFYSNTELREMIKGFEMLFGIKPVVRIQVHGRHGLPSGTGNKLTGEMLFFPHVGFELQTIGNFYLTVITGPDSADVAKIDADDNLVTFHAAFYLP